MKKKVHLILATAAVALLTSNAPAMAELSLTTTKTTKTSVGPLGTDTGTVISAQTTADKVVKETVTNVKDATGATISTTTTTQTAPLTTRSQVEVNTTEQPVMPTGARVYNTADFDTNKDGVLTTAEVGNHLFDMYDADGNGMIDNVEYERKAVLTVTPVQKSTTITYDLNGDGITEKQETVYQDFLRYSQLARFDGDLDGLSPHEFVGRSFLKADIDGDKMISKKEWQGSYNAEIDRSNKIKGKLNK